VNHDQLTLAERTQLMAVLRELDTAAPREKRREPRRKVIVELWIQPLGKPRPARQKAFLVNVSKRGLALVTQRGLAVESRFVVTLRFEDGGGWLVLCEVRNCSSADDEFKVGATLLDRIDDPKGNSKPPMDWIL
jgi:hypothetical protein